MKPRVYNFREERSMEKLAGIRQEISDIPRALRETLDKGRPEYEELVRRTRWGEGPIYILSDDSSWPCALTGAYAFESLLGWPVVARPASVFLNYGRVMVRPRSIILAISSNADSEALLEAARAARSRGAVLLVLAQPQSSPLVKMADGVFLLRPGAQQEHGLTALVCQHAALSAIALFAAGILKKHDNQADKLVEEFNQLPRHVEWLFSHLSDAAQSLGSELAKASRVWIVGGGFYHPTALQAAVLLREIAALDAEGAEATEFRCRRLEKVGNDACFLFLSGTRCRIKREIHQGARRAKEKGGNIFSVTDSNDVELADQSKIAILLTVLSEMTGATLMLALLEWLAYQLARGVQRQRH